MSETDLDRIMQIPGRSTRAIVDLDAITDNVRSIASHLLPDQRVIAVVKAEGYGHGAVMVGRTALAAGAEMLAVATVGEAANLRAHQVSAPILILGPVDPTELARATELECELSIGSEELLRILLASEHRPAVHLKIDTGMHRYGVAPEDAVRAAVALDQGGFALRGIMTHFSSADEPDLRPTETQRDLLDAVVARILPEIAQRPSIHEANSAGSLRGLPGTFIRLGVAMYGLRPGTGAPLHPDMRPALSVVSRLARVHVAHPGDGVSYGRTYVEPADERLGLLPIGYADGLHRLLSNRGWMGVAGAKCPIRGRVCMDQTVIGDIPETAMFGATVGVMGPIGGGPSLDDIAAWADTINYEVATSISARVPRYYLSDGQMVASLIEGMLCEA